MRRRVHPGRDRHRLELVGLRRTAKLGRWLTRGKPGLELVRGEDERHALVDRPHELIGSRGDDGEGLQRLLLTMIVPALPEPSKGDRGVVAATDEEGLLGRAFLLPLVEPSGWHKTPSVEECLAIGRLLENGLGAGVDHTVADRDILGPAG